MVPDRGNIRVSVVRYLRTSYTSTKLMVGPKDREKVSLSETHFDFQSFYGTQVVVTDDSQSIKLTTVMVSWLLFFIF